MIQNAAKSLLAEVGVPDDIDGCLPDRISPPPRTGEGARG